MFLRGKSGAINGVVTQDLPEASVAYEQLASMRDPNTGQTLWEDIPEQDIGSAARCIVIPNLSGAAVGADETVSGVEPGRPGTVTSAFYVAQSPGIVGAATNSRTLTIVQGTAQGAGTPARTTIATLALVNGVNAPANQLSAAFTINSAAIIADAPLELVSTHVGTGIADPGGLGLIVYTAQ